MAEYVAFEPDVQVNGETVYSVVDGMGAFRDYALDILRQNGIPDPQPGAWYGQQSWLNAFKTIATRIGPRTLFAIGKKIPENAQFPPEIQDIHQALAAIDVAYHMNHRRQGRVLFDPSTGTMLEGIGHYTYHKKGENNVEMICNNPYPCEFDRGIIDAMATRFKPKSALFVKVEHAADRPCRRSGGESCTYRVTW